jgi:hypothetical protein
VLCLSVGFSVGQVVDQPAGAEVQAANVQEVRDAKVANALTRLYVLQLDAQVDNIIDFGAINRYTKGTCLDVRALLDALNQKPR